MRMPLRWGRAMCLGASILVVFAGACARTDRGREARITPRTDAPVSPRVIPPGQPVPKGGGTYKVGNPYRIDGALFTPAEDPAYDRTGIASFYSEDFHGRKTANGEIFDMWALTAAHPTLPLPSYAYVTNIDQRAHAAGAHQRQGPLCARACDRSFACQRAAAGI